MPNTMTSREVAPSLLQILRDATHHAHEEIDTAFSAIDLQSKSGYARFLTAHFMGITPIFPAMQSFAQNELGVSSPDLPALLRSDLTELGVDASTLPALRGPDDQAGAAICYVLGGSRLGVASIGAGPYWAKDQGIASRYMQDREGLAVWRKLTGWMREHSVSAGEADRQSASAIAAFDLFRSALQTTNEDCGLPG